MSDEMNKTGNGASQDFLTHQLMLLDIFGHKACPDGILVGIQWEACTIEKYLHKYSFHFITQIDVKDPAQMPLQVEQKLKLMELQKKPPNLSYPNADDDDDVFFPSKKKKISKRKR